MPDANRARLTQAATRATAAAAKVASCIEAAKTSKQAIEEGNSQCTADIAAAMKT